jgi:DNA-binding CsgD family transcriptional regulator
MRMLQDAYLSAMEAETSDELRMQVIRFARRLEFDTVSATTVVDHSPRHTKFHCVDNTPPAARAEFFCDVAAARLDPVMQHCKTQCVPIVWDQSTYTDRGYGPMWEVQAKFGYKTGIALALHLPNDRHFFIGVDRDQRLTQNSRRLTHIVAELQLFAVHAQVAALRIFAPSSSPDSEVPSLTPRESEALRWTMDGKLAWEIGEVLNISERAVVFHLQNAMRKLGCKSKFQAVLKAIRLGLLT